MLVPENAVRNRNKPDAPIHILQILKRISIWYDLQQWRRKA